MAASLALVKVPRYLILPSILIIALNFFPALDTPLKPVVLVHVTSFLYLIFGIISISPSCKTGKFRSDLGRFAWMAARSYAMAASFVVPK